eukprot:433501_1
MDFDKEPPLKKRKLDEKQIIEDNIEEIREPLELLGAKSNLVFQSEGEDELNPPIILDNDNGVIPLRKDIISSIQQSRYLLWEFDHLTNLITDFIVTDHADQHFTTKQFLEILFSEKNIGKTGNFVDYFFDADPKTFLLNIMLEQIDRKRKALNRSNLMQLTGVDGQDETEINFDFIEFMQEHLMDTSIITVPIDAEWEFSHYHFIVGRNKQGHIVGYQCEVFGHDSFVYKVRKPAYINT